MNQLHLPAAIIVFSLLLSGTIFVVGTGISRSISGITVLAGADSGGKAPVQDSGSGDSQDKAPLVIDELLDDDPYIGENDAKIVIVEFSDFQCPVCRRFFDDSYAQLKADYIDTGKAKLVYRDYPISSIHPAAQKAAEASECAGEQGRFWEYHDKLFENQENLAVENLKAYAADLGLDSPQFNACLDAGEKQQEVLKDLSDGAKYGVTGTPNFFIGKKGGEAVHVRGLIPYASLKQFLDAELAD